MPQACLASSNIVSKLPVKGFLVIMVFAMGIFVANWYVDREVPFEERCSSHYPEFAVVLDLPQFLEDGSVRSEDNVYTPGTFWVSEGVVRGCPCSIRSCIRKCCCCGGCSDECAKSWNFSEFHSMIGDNGFYAINASGYHSNYSLNTVDVNSSALAVKELDPLENVTSLKTFNTFFLLDNSTISAKFKEESLDGSKHCLRDTRRGNVFVSVCSEEDTGPEDMPGGALLLIQTMMAVSILVNTVNLVAFTLIPRLRSGYGYGLMSYVASRCVKTMATQIFYMGWLDGVYFPCVFLAATIQFLETASRAWQVVTSYQMWAAFRPGGRGPEGTQEHEGHLLYNSLAWGLPLGLALFTLLADLVPGSPHVLRPLYGQHSCWYNNLPSLYIFFVIPVALGELVNLVRCLCTLRRLRQYQRDSETLQGSDNRCHNAREIRWSSIYLKVCLVMGINYILGSVMVLISWTSRTADYFRYAAETVMHMRGVEVFFIFVLKKKNLKLLLQRKTNSSEPQSRSTQGSRIKSSSKDNTV